MIWDAYNGKDKKLVDAKGREVKFVKSFDDETGEAIIYKQTLGEGMKEIKTKFEGAKIVDKE